MNIIMISTKPFHSFFICLLAILYITHSSHSLVNSHTLRKRMQEAESLGSAGRAFASGGQAVSHPPVSLDVPRDLMSMESGNLHSATPDLESLHPNSPLHPISPPHPNPSPDLNPPRDPHPPLHPNPPPPPPSKPGGISSVFHTIKEWGMSLNGKLRKISQRFKDLIQSNKWLSDHNLSSEEIDKVVDDFVENHSTLTKNHPSFYRDLNHRIKTPLENSKTALEKLDEIAVQMKQKQAEISNNIQPILVKIEDGKAPDEVLAKNMATTHSDILATDQKAVQDLLPTEQKYLSKLLGFMGPDNVLRPFIQSTFREYFYKGVLNDEIVEEKVELLWKELENLQLNLAKLAKFPQESYKMPDSEYPNLIMSIENNESKLADLFNGGRDELEREIKTVEKTNFHKEFMEELQRPTSAFGYQLQFLQPWGLLHQYQDLSDPVKDLTYEEFGILHSEESLKTIMQQKEIVKEDINRAILILTDYAEQRKILAASLNHQDIGKILKHLKRADKINKK